MAKKSRSVQIGWPLANPDSNQRRPRLEGLATGRSVSAGQPLQELFEPHAAHRLSVLTVGAHHHSGTLQVRQAVIGFQKRGFAATAAGRFNGVQAR